MKNIFITTHTLIAAMLVLMGPALAHAQVDPTSDWQRRATAPGVVKAVGFDDIHEWAKYIYEGNNCNPAYQVMVDGKIVGCRTNAFDPSVKASGGGALRFDILSRSPDDGAGSVAIPFGSYETSQFGANSEFYISWRQLMDQRFIQPYKTSSGSETAFKQIIISQGDLADTQGRSIESYSCTENEMVVVSTFPDSMPTRPAGYIECGGYRGFRQWLSRGEYSGDSLGSSVLTVQNGMRSQQGLFNCVTFPNYLDQSGCFNYPSGQWVTYMVHMKLGPEGRAVSSVASIEQPGYINSSYELFVAAPGQDFKLLHRQTGLVIPKGQYYLGGDPALSTSYRGGMSAHNAHPQAKYGKLWLLPYMTGKDAAATNGNASTWYDEVIISKCRIAAPGYPNATDCTSPPANATPTPAPVQPPTPTPAPTPVATPAPTASYPLPGSSASPQAWTEDATQSYFNFAQKLRWTNNLGDWVDANGVPQGPTPFASVLLKDTDMVKAVDLDVTELVRRYGANFRVSKIGGNQAIFKSREASSGRPQLILVKNGVTSTMTPAADTFVDVTTIYSLGTLKYLKVRNGMYLRFAQGSDSGITKATLRLISTEQYGDMTIQVMRPAPNFK